MSSRYASPLSRRGAALAMSIACVGFASLFAAASRLDFKATAFQLPEPLVRGAGHFMVFGLLALLLAIGLRGRVWTAWVLTLVLAAADEAHQAWLPNRHATVSDWLINAAGASLCLLLYVAWRSRRGSPAPTSPAAALP